MARVTARERARLQALEDQKKQKEHDHQRLVGVVAQAIVADQKREEEEKMNKNTNKPVAAVTAPSNSEALKKVNTGEGAVVKVEAPKVAVAPKAEEIKPSVVETAPVAPVAPVVPVVPVAPVVTVAPQAVVEERPTVEKKVVRANKDLKPIDWKYEHQEKTMTVADFMQPQTQAKFMFNDPLQRNTVWTIEQKSNLIHTILQGLYVPPAVAQLVTLEPENGKGKKKTMWNILDGKQRYTGIRDFKLNKIKLSKKTPYVDGFDEEGNEVWVDISGLSFDELPTHMQHRIDSYTLRVVELELDTDEQKALVFGRLNSGTPLRAQEKRKTLMTVDLMKFSNQVREKDIYTAGVAKNSLNSDQNGEMVLQSMLMVMTDGDTALNTLAINNFTTEGDADKEELQRATFAVAHYLSNVVSEFDDKKRKDNFTKLRAVSIFPVAKIAMQKNIKPEMFAQWVDTFFNTDYEKHDFKKYSTGGSASKAMVVGRVTTAMNHFKETFKKEMEATA